MVTVRTNVERERERERESTYANLFIVGYGSKEKLWQHAGGNQNTGTGVWSIMCLDILTGSELRLFGNFFPLQTPTVAAAETDRYSSVLRSVFSHSDDDARRRLSVTRSSCPVRANIAAATAPCFA